MYIHIYMYVSVFRLSKYFLAFTTRKISEKSALYSIYYVK